MQMCWADKTKYKSNTDISAIIINITVNHPGTCGFTQLIFGKTIAVSNSNYKIKPEMTFADVFNMA